jgi:hypothetical protein
MGTFTGRNAAPEMEVEMFGTFVRTLALPAALVGVLMMGIAPAAQAAPKEKRQVLVLYSENRGLHVFDDNMPGIDHGDLFARENAISFTYGGPVVGVSYSQGEVIAHDPRTNTDVRRVFIQTLLPKGRLFGMSVSELDRGAVPAPGWVNSYAIIGGTGKYAGARGEMTLVLLPDGKTFRAVSRFTL